MCAEACVGRTHFDSAASIGKRRSRHCPYSVAGRERVGPQAYDPVVRPPWILTLTLMALGPVEARANDGVFGGSGAALAPLASTPIRMLREDIIMELTGRPLAWSVKAVYEFENPTSSQVVVQMGYPETRCDAEEGDCSGQGGRFRGLDTRVRGRSVRHRVGRVTENSAWATELDRVYLFDVTFAPRERVRVEHRYTYDRSFTSVIGENVFYLTRTGALWNGPIGQARFTVRTPIPPFVVEHPRTFELTSWDRGVVGGRGVTTLLFAVRNWRPAEDFGVLLGDSARIEIGTPVGDGSVDLSDCASGLRGPGRTREARRLETEMIRALSPRELQGCRDLVLALNGSPISDRQFRRALTGGPAPESGMGEDWVVETLRPATSFTGAQVFPRHAAFVRRLDLEIARRASAHE